MWQAAAVLVAFTFLVGAAHGQVTAQFWVITENGNSFELDGPPPARPPGFDTAPFLNIRPLDTALSLTAGPAAGVAPVATFGEAGVVTELPAYDPTRTEMAITIVRDWGRSTDSMPLYSPMLVGDLGVRGGIPYLGPAKVGNDTAIDLMEMCNAGVVDGFIVSCVDNRRGNTINAARVADYGHVLDVPSTGRTIIHVSNANGTDMFEVMFTCPDCRMDALAYHGSGGGRFEERGFRHSSAIATPEPPFTFGAGNLTGLAWDSTSDGNGITYWQDGGSCTPTLNIAGGSIHGACPGAPIQAGTVQATAWQPLSPGWNAVRFPADSYIIVMDPGSGARLQIREGQMDAVTSEPVCCFGFDGGVLHKARVPGQPAKAAVIHDTDRHLLVVPYGGSVPADQTTLAEQQALHLAIREEPRGTLRWLAHSDPGDPIYHGFFYDERGVWPPYQVRLVEARNINFAMPPLDVLAHLHGSNYTHDDMLRVLNIGPGRGPLMDSDIYDIRNDKLLRSDEGRFILWDGTHVDRPYIQPWFNLQKNPVWELYGVDLPRDRMLVVDAYATIPVVKPTRLANTYLSSLPCGYPDASEVTGPLRDATFDAATTGGYDDQLIEFLLFADGGGPIDDNMLLQHVYMASRTYLDYLDSDYLAGDSIHVPVLDGRPYLCTTIAPNILESQYLLYGLPFGDSYVSLGGREGVAEVRGGFGPGWDAKYVHHAGVQSPRDGVIALDVTARLGAAVSAVGMGNTLHGATVPTGQWANGTIQVDAKFSAGPTTVDLGSFMIDTYDIVEETYLLEGGTCYGRFVTVPDSSGYIVKTVTVSASQGEHIPVVLNLTASAPGTLTTYDICDGTEFESVVMQFLLQTFAIDVR